MLAFPLEKRMIQTYQIFKVLDIGFWELGFSQLPESLKLSGSCEPNKLIL